MTTQSITLSTENGDSQLTLGTVISSNPLGVSRLILARNHSDKPVKFRLSPSDNVASFVSFAHRYDQDENFGSLPLEQPGNLNLVYTEHDYNPYISIDGKAAKVVSLYVNVSSSENTSNRDGLTAPQHFSGALNAVDEQGTVLCAIPLHGSLCESRLALDTVRLDYGYCDRLVWAVRELAVRNLSSVPTRFCISTGLRSCTDNGQPTCLQFFDAAGDEDLDPASVHIGPGEARLIRVKFRPAGAVKEEKWFSVENLYNPRDLWHVRVFANARSGRVAESIDVDCGPMLDFGDCYASCPTYRDVTLISKCHEPVRVTMNSDRRNQVRFEVLQDWVYGDAVRFDERATAVNDAGFRSLNHIHASRLNDVFDKPLSPRGSAGSTLASTPMDDIVQNLDALKRHTSGSRFSSIQGSQADSREHVTQRTGFTKTKPCENVTLDPGQRRFIRIWYLPLCVPVQQAGGLGPDSDLDRGRLLSDSFQLSFKLPSGESRMIEGRSRVCESILRLEREGVFLGDCNVLTKYKSVLSIINCSDLSASATISYVSQCVVADAHEVIIRPRETFDLGLNFIPRQVNPGYHKEITIRNLWNPNSPNLVFTLRANCIDRQGISLHALFYKILAPNPTNEIDFGVTVANHPAIRAFRVRNITKQKLILKFSTRNGVKIYMLSRVGELMRSEAEKVTSERADGTFEESLAQKSSQFSHLEELEGRLESTRFLDGLLDLDIQKRSSSMLSMPGARQTEPSCELQGGADRPLRFARDFDASGDDASDLDKDDELGSIGGKGGWIEFLRSVEGGEFALLDSMPMFFSNHDSELSYTERQFLPVRRLQAALRAGYLSEENILVLGPEAETLVLISMVLTDVEVRGRTKTRPFEKKLVVQMLAFDNKRLSDAAPNSSKEFNNIAKQFEGGQVSMPREILLTVQACKSWMQIEPLRQLNFGTIPCGEHKDKAFTIVNMSEAPLLYQLKKSGSETSDDLRFNLGEAIEGVVRPYFSKVVPFIYAPTKEGIFEENIIVENRLDKGASGELVVRAIVTNPAPSVSSVSSVSS